MGLTIADRRAISASAMLDPKFREALFKSPHDAVREATGKQLPATTRFEVLEEGAAGWCFVMLDAAAIDRDLPEARDARSAVENDVYALLRDQPALASAAERDPVSFLRERLQIEVDDVVLRKEGADDAILVVWNQLASEELPDDFLDLVSAGGDTGCQSADWSSQRNSDNGGT